jgi:single-stranded-DNA-specific exonuclease
VRFGGHAMAAGCTIAGDDLDAFRAALHDAALGLGTTPSERRIATDGPLAAAHWNADTVRLIEGEVWGAAFEAPVFCDTVEVVSQRLVGDKHLKLALRLNGSVRDAIWFGRVEPVADRLRLAYRLELDSYNGEERLQMLVVAAEPLQTAALPPPA